MSRLAAWFTRGHVWFYRATKGAIAGRGPLRQVVLTTRGRRSGQARHVVLGGLNRGEAVLLVASNGGQDRHPAWFLNLSQHPQVTLQTGRTVRRMHARAADGAEYDELWRHVTTVAPMYTRYESRTSRRIPVVVCEPEPASEAATR